MINEFHMLSSDTQETFWEYFPKDHPVCRKLALNQLKYFFGLYEFRQLYNLLTSDENIIETAVDKLIENSVEHDWARRNVEYICECFGKQHNFSKQAVTTLLQNFQIDELCKNWIVEVFQGDETICSQARENFSNASLTHRTHDTTFGTPEGDVDIQSVFDTIHSTDSSSSDDM